MKILLDTHIALWAVADTEKLSGKAIQILEDTKNEVFYSIASVWEVAIKHKLRPEQMPMSEEEFAELCENTGFILFPITREQIFMVKTLSRSADAPKHNDPFDRLLIAQAKADNMKFMTHDALLPYYREECVMEV